jgi:hypothetical protein
VTGIPESSLFMTVLWHIYHHTASSLIKPIVILGGGIFAQRTIPQSKDLVLLVQPEKYQGISTLYNFSPVQISLLHLFCLIV